jgi:hypothetical protein
MSRITNDVIYEDEEFINVVQFIAKPKNLSSGISAVTNNTSNNTSSDMSNTNNTNNTNSIDTMNTSNIAIRNALNFRGPPYLLIVCKELQNIKGTGIIKDFFYRINLSGKLGEYVFDSFVDSPIFYNEPIRHINMLTLDIVAPDGTYYDFNGVDHSFVLEIVTFDEIPEGTSLKY